MSLNVFRPSPVQDATSGLVQRASVLQVFETAESWGAGAKTSRGSQQRVKEVTANARAVDLLRQRVSIEVQSRNAAAVMRTVDTTKKWSNLFLLSSAFLVPFVYLSPLWSI